MKRLFHFKELSYAKTNANEMKIKTAKRKLFTLLAILCVSIGMASATVATSNYSNKNLNYATLGVPAAALAGSAAISEWLKSTGNKEFKLLSPDEFEKLTEEEQSAYHKAHHDYTILREKEIAKRIGEINALTEKTEQHTKELEDLKKELNGISLADIRELMKAVKEQGEYLKAQKDAGHITKDTFENRLKSAFDKEIEKLRTSKKTRGNSVQFEVQKNVDYGDIDSGLDFAQMRPGIVNKPVRMPKLRSLFRSTPVSTEYFKYVDQETVVRDAQNVAKCAAPATKNTKETIKVRSIQTEIIKDIVPICRDFVDDYPFMRSRVNMLLEESVALRIEQQLFKGTGVSPELFSLDYYSSEFSAANPVANVALKIQAATYIDLALSMATQIYELGEQGSYNPDLLLVNKVDWFLYAESRKDANNNYLDSRITYINGNPYVGGMRVVWFSSACVAQNQLYVCDSTKGEIVDRTLFFIDISFENNDNWEKEIAEIKGYERLNFLVTNNNKNAFMKCSDVASAITAITKP